MNASEIYRTWPTDRLENTRAEIVRLIALNKWPWMRPAWESALARIGEVMAERGQLKLEL